MELVSDQILVNDGDRLILDSGLNLKSGSSEKFERLFFVNECGSFELRLPSEWLAMQGQ